MNRGTAIKITCLLKLDQWMDDYKKGMLRNYR